MKLNLQEAIIALLIFITASSYGAQSRNTLNFHFYTQTDSVGYWGDTLDLARRIHPQDFKDHLDVARARFAITGKFNNWFYDLNYDAADQMIKEAFVRYEELPYFRFSIGEYKIPYNFWFLTGHVLSNFLEYSLPTLAFNPGYRLAVHTEFMPGPFTLTFGLVSSDVQRTIMGMNVHGDTPLARNGRITFSPIHNDNYIIHLASSVIFQNSDSLERFRFAAFPEVLSRPIKNLVGTGFINQAIDYRGIEGEAAFILGSFTIESEYYYTRVNRYIQSVKFDGFSICADLFLTGEHYKYSFKKGAIEGITSSRNPSGTWQLAARYSMLDLEDDGVKGGRERNWTLGLNWIFNRNLKLVLNYIFADAFPSNNGLNRNLHILALRCQLSD